MSTPDDTRRAVLRNLAAKGENLRFCVIGAGHGGMAMAAHLGLMGFPVNLYNRTDENLAGVRWHGGINLTGEVEGFGPVRLATSNLSDALADADVVMIVTPANAHAPLAKAMVPYLRDEHIVVLNPGRTGGALEFRKVLRDTGTKSKPLLAETQTFVYASRALSRTEAHIFRVKNRVPLATLPAHWIPEVLAILRTALPQFVAGSNVLVTSLDNIGAVFHPALTLLNAGWIEATGGDFDYYLDGITPAVAKILEQIDTERVRAAEALGVQTHSAREWLYLTYDSPGRDLYEAIHNTASYRGIRAPQNIGHRYITEDVPMSLVPLASLGAMLGRLAPTMETIIRLAGTVHGRDYWAEGRTVERLGLAGLTVKQIHQLVTRDA